MQMVTDARDGLHTDHLLGYRAAEQPVKVFVGICLWFCE